MKKVAGTLRIDLAQYREMEVFTQFSSDLDRATRDMLDYGDRLMELLKQPLYRPLPLDEQVILLCAARHKLMQDITLPEIRSFSRGIIDHINANYPEIIKEINETGKLSDELEQSIVKAVKDYKES